MRWTTACWCSRHSDLVGECYKRTVLLPIGGLIDTSPPAQVVCTAIPGPYKNPDPRLQAAHEAYQAALAAARPPAPARPPTPGAEPSGQFAKRPGFA